MLSLPSKPWKKVRIDELVDDEYRVIFLSELEGEAQFEEIVEEDIVASLGELDRVVARDWTSRSVVVKSPDPSAFKRNLVFACIMVELT